MSKHFWCAHISDLSYEDEVMALGGTIRGVYGCVMHILLPGFNGLENIVDHQAFLIITCDLVFYNIGKDDVHDIAWEC